ncbi:MAG: cation transporter [Atopobiaceae bacterium]|nr:cation transporter [Atopobiaceae bacterium]
MRAPRDASNVMLSEADRKAAIVRVSLIGIVANVALAAFKAIVGILSHSIAIVLDAVNNLSDAASSIVTIIGTRLAGKRPDREHPFGHGRAEYLTTIVVATIVLWAGLTSLSESVERILHPETPSYEPIMLVIVAVAVLVKLMLGRYVKSEGARLNADVLVASGEDALMDAVISASTLVAAVIYLTLGISLEAWLGAVISLVIIKAGIEMLREAISKILGERIDSEVARSVKDAACAVDGVRGAYDLILTDYGPQRLQGSVHVEVDEHLTAPEIDRLTRKIQLHVLRETGVILHTVGIYSTNADDDNEVAFIRATLEELIEQEEHVLQLHGLYVDQEKHTVTFDLVVSFDAPDRSAVVDRVASQMRERFPEYRFTVVLDSDISD